jgi:hypothetical protein
MTPTQRTIKRFKDQGIMCGVVERWIQFGKNDPRRGIRPGQRIDLFGIIDIIAATPDGVVGVQCCAGSGNSAHIKKITEDKRENAERWLRCPGAGLEVHAWRKIKVKRGGKAMKWEPKITVIRLEDLK